MLLQQVLSASFVVNTDILWMRIDRRMFNSPALSLRLQNIERPPKQSGSVWTRIRCLQYWVLERLQNTHLFSRVTLRTGMSLTFIGQLDLPYSYVISLDWERDGRQGCLDFKSFYAFRSTMYARNSIPRLLQDEWIYSSSSSSSASTAVCAIRSSQGVSNVR